MRRRRGSSSGILLILGSVILLVAAIVLLRMNQNSGQANSHADSLRLYCAAGIKPVIEAAIREYQAEFGTRVEVQYGGSGTLLSQLEVRPDGVDLYLAADSSYLRLAQDKGLVRETLTLSKLQPILAVAAGNPLGLDSTSSILQPNVRLGLANPDAAAVGKIAKKVYSQTGDWATVAEHCKVYKPTVNEIANDVVIGSIDAAIVWDSTIALIERLEAVELPEFSNATRTVTVGITTTTTRPAAALRFARYLNSRERGSKLFAKHGFQTIEGDHWAPTPEIVFFAGSIFNQAIEDTIKDFEKREGVEVSRVYNGCGILVGQMRAGASPDAYFSCDNSFMERVGDLFHPSSKIAENRLVLIATKSNSKRIENVNDLVIPGLRVGLAHPEKSALGHLTLQLLDELKITEPLKTSGNWKQDAPQGDFLVNSLRTGALDAAIVYASNAQPFAESELAIIRIEHPSAVAIQPYAIARTSQYPATMRRLLQAIRSKSSKERFEDLGFRWIAENETSETP